MPGCAAWKVAIGAGSALFTAFSTSVSEFSAFCRSDVQFLSPWTYRRFSSRTSVVVVVVEVVVLVVEVVVEEVVVGTVVVVGAPVVVVGVAVVVVDDVGGLVVVEDVVVDGDVV